MRTSMKVLAALVMATVGVSANATKYSVDVDAIILNNADGDLQPVVPYGSHLPISIVVDTADVDADGSSNFLSTNPAALGTDFIIDVLGPASISTVGSTSWNATGYISIVPALPGSGVYLPLTINVTGVGMTPNQIMPNFTSGIGGTITLDGTPLGDGHHLVTASIAGITITPAVDSNHNGIDDSIDPTILDSDGDGIVDADDDCPHIADPTQNDPCNPNIIDTDGDGIVDALDNCPFVSNPDQADLDGDGIGDVCDGDQDGDGMLDTWEVAHGLNPRDPTDAPLDPDHDGLTNLQEYTAGSDPHVVDSDGDGVPDGTDNCPGVYNPTQADMDHDGIGDACDIDIDGDGMLNIWEQFHGTNPLVADGTLNPDHDGANNYTEFLNDTNPQVFDVPLRVVHDIDGDKKADQVFVKTSNGATQYWSDANKSTSVYVGVPSGYAYAGTGDFNGDGYADVLFTKAPNQVKIWGGGYSADAVNPGTAPNGYSLAAICDVNGDNADDVVWYNATTGATQLWLGSTTAAGYLDKSSATYPGKQLTSTMHVAACADFDGDLKSDLFWYDSTTGKTQIWHGASKVGITYPGTQTDLTKTIIGAGDTTGVGVADLVWYKAAGGQVQIWPAGKKASVITAGTLSTTYAPVALYDYDGDGKVDLLWAKTSGVLYTQIWPGVVKAAAINPGTLPTGYTAAK